MRKLTAGRLGACSGATPPSRPAPAPGPSGTGVPSRRVRPPGRLPPATRRRQNRPLPNRRLALAAIAVRLNDAAAIKDEAQDAHALDIGICVSHAGSEINAVLSGGGGRVNVVSGRRREWITADRSLGTVLLWSACWRGLGAIAGKHPLHSSIDELNGLLHTTTLPISGESAGAMDDLRVLTKSEAAQLAGVSEDTLDRMIRSGEGLRCVQLSPRRVGIVRRDFKAWLDSRPLTIIAA
jgi:predicted DNA-binding transcriptional regulator AlpA